MKQPSVILSRIDGFIFDLDGTLYLGENALPGAVKIVQTLRQMGKQALFVSNKPLFPRQYYAAKLTSLGIPTAPEDVITSGYVLGFYLAKSNPDLRLYVIGEENLKSELRGFGLNVLEEFIDQDPFEVIYPDGVDAVVVAFDRTLTYRKLNTAYQALQRGAAFMATNPDRSCPMPGGGIPDAGGTIAALEYMTGRRVELVAGKPSNLMMQVALQHLGLPAERCLLVGDRLQTDIAMGKAAGMTTALVLSGVTTRLEAEQADPRPDIILSGVGDLLSYLSRAE
jgi:arabinose operon protein AraL